MAGPSTKPYNVSELKARLMRPALTSHYICQFSPPQDVINWLSQRGPSRYSGEVFTAQNNELLQISCSDASLPGSSLNTNEVNDDFTGVTQRFAYRRLYDDRSDFTFYVDNDYKIISFFEGWMSYIMGEEGSDRRLTRSNYFYRARFPDNYRSDNLYITKFEKDSDTLSSGRSLQYQFIGAYPISINSMPVSYEQSQLLKCTVSFTYDRYVINKNSMDELGRGMIQDRLVREDNRRGAAAAAAGRGLEELNRANLEAFRRENPGVNI